MYMVVDCLCIVDLDHPIWVEVLVLDIIAVCHRDIIWTTTITGVEDVVLTVMEVHPIEWTILTEIDMMMKHGLGNNNIFVCWILDSSDRMMHNVFFHRIIDDPLKEFERLMREKDRRKKMNQSGGARKRSKSRSFSPVLRSPPRRLSPFPPKRSRSRSPFSRSRSPSPKRKRPPPPAPKRRRSYSRSPSRSPRPLRRGGKSRLEEHSLDTKRFVSYY